MTLNADLYMGETRPEYRSVAALITLNCASHGPGLHGRLQKGSRRRRTRAGTWRGGRHRVPMTAGVVCEPGQNAIDLRVNDAEWG